MYSCEAQRSVSSEVTALHSTTSQLVPKTDHLPWGLVMCSVIVLHASILTKLPVMGVLDGRHGTVELLNPHSHAHILHLEKLQPNNHYV